MLNFSVFYDSERDRFEAKFRLDKRQFRLRLKSSNRSEAEVEAASRIATEVEPNREEWLAKPRRETKRLRGEHSPWLEEWFGISGVYAVRISEFFKIGRANDFGYRFRNMQSDSPYRVSPIAWLSKETSDEKKFLQMFKHLRAAGGGLEWFHLSREVYDELRRLDIRS